MAVKLGELVWEITGDDSDIRNKVKRTEKSVFNLGNVFKVAFAVTAVKAIASVGKALVGAASDAEETNNKFNVVFDSVIDSANEMASTLATDYGLARTESKALLASTGDLLVGFGVAKDQALDLSFRVQTLAADLASFTNFSGGAAGASQALTSALLGETEAAKSLGLSLGETALRQFAEEQGVVFKNLTQQEKMFLRLELAVSQSGSAIGDFARSINSFANQTRIAEANAQNLQEVYGEALLPLATLGVKIFNQNAAAAEKSAKAFVNFVKSAEGAEQIGDALGAIGGSLRVMVAIFDIFVKQLSPLGNAISEAVDDLGSMTTASERSSIFLTLLSNSISFTASVLKVLAVAFAGAIKNLVNFVRVIIDSGRVVGSFYKALRGQATWDQFQANVKLAGTAYKTLGTDVIKNTKKLFAAISEGSGKTAEEQEKTAKSIVGSFEKTSGAISKSVQGVLTAQQQIAQSSASSVEKQAKKTGELGKEYRKVIEAQSAFAAAFGQGSIESFKFFKELEKSLKDAQLLWNAFGSGISNVLGAVDNLQKARTDKQLGALDSQMQAELEAAGLAEETAVQAAQRELELAEATGTAEEQQEAKNALKKAQIEEKFAKRKAEVEYKAAVSGWEIQKQLAAIQVVVAPLNAFVSSLSAPWPLNMILPPINAAFAAATAGLQYAAVVESKPQKPSFQFGGIVPGSSFSGDNVQANVNSGEMVLTQRQQSELFNMANGQGSGGGMMRVVGSRELTFQELFTAMENGELFVPERAIVSR